MVREQLANLNRTPGVLGTCLCSKEGEILASTMPDVFDAESLSEAARAAADALAGLETIKKDAWELDFVYEQYFCIVRRAGDRFVFLLCEPTVAMPVLKLSISVIAKRLADAPAEEFENPISPPLVGVESLTSPPSAPSLPPASSESSRSSGSSGSSEFSEENSLDIESVRLIIDEIGKTLLESFGQVEADALIDRALTLGRLDLSHPTRDTLRTVLNELLNKGLSKDMDKAEATTWLNQLIEQHGLSRKDS